MEPIANNPRPNFRSSTISPSLFSVRKVELCQSVAAT
jgi:hypothetical protein